MGAREWNRAEKSEMVQGHFKKFVFGRVIIYKHRCNPIFSFSRLLAIFSCGRRHTAKIR